MLENGFSPIKSWSHDHDHGHDGGVTWVTMSSWTMVMNQGRIHIWSESTLAPPPFWQINHANSAYFRLFLGWMTLFIHIGSIHVWYTCICWFAFCKVGVKISTCFKPSPDIKRRIDLLSGISLNNYCSLIKQRLWSQWTYFLPWGLYM